MIREDYVSFETAKLLKEKGFHGECLSMYVTPKPHCGMGNPNEPKIAPHGRDSHYYEGYLYQCEAPTLQVTFKWLREVHNIHIAILPSEVGAGVMDYTYVLYKIDAKNFYFENLGIQGRSENINEISYENVAEEAIKYVLENLI